MSRGCYVCGSAAISPASRMGSPVCDGCLPAQDHVISSQKDRLVCQCGWTAEKLPFTDRKARDEACKFHWNREIAKAAAQVPA